MGHGCCWQRSIFSRWQQVFGWNDIEQTINSGNFSFDINAKTIGNVTFQGVRGVAYNGTFFAVADAGSDTIYIWNGVPNSSDNPVYSLQV
ncbi:MAG: hypothetical protein Ct9H90mP10_10410 [Actinomycetota bacterium]|nr:MAG: hypothetical protein Ct9H90mP10_10410 [Actinomycetota bacterium]